MISLRCCSNSDTVCSTSRAKLSVLSSLRVILDTEPSGNLGNLDRIMTEGPEKTAPFSYVPQNPGSSGLSTFEFPYADDCGSFTSAHHVAGRKRKRKIHAFAFHLFR